MNIPTNPVAASAAALSSDAELQMLRESARGYLERHWPSNSAVERSMDATSLGEIWLGLAEQGFAALAGSADAGGLRELVVVTEELGRAGCPAPFLGAVLANLALRDRPEAAQLLAQIETGSATIAVAFGNFDGDPNAGSVTVEGGRVSGLLSFVEGTLTATHLLVFLENCGLAIVERAASGVEIVFAPGLSVPPLARITVTDTPATILSAAPGDLEDLVRIARLALVARSFGAATRAFEMVVDYAKERQQFGQPIGKFQAIQHKLANCLTSLEGVRLTLSNAAIAHDLGNASWRILAAAACAFANTALRQVSLETHHTFGAVGYAEEHEAPRHFRRIHGDLTRLGGVSRARAELSAHLLDANDSLPEYDLGPAGNAFRQEVHAWLADNWTAEHKAAYQALPYEYRGFDPEFSQRLGKTGWVGLTWPIEFGGLAAAPMQKIAFMEETLLAHTPMYAHEIAESLCAPAIMKFGTAEQKDFFLPKMRAGELSMSLGYSEPGSGSDLASMTTSAMRDGDEWVINGQKIWSTLADKAEYVWLAVRTDPDANPKHAGISIFTFPLNTSGVTIRPSMNMYGFTFCNVFYDNVRVPQSALIGELNGGWKVITSALADERLQMGGWTIELRREFDKLLGFVRSTSAKLDPVVRDRIGALAAEIEVARRFVMNAAEVAEHNRVPIVEAAISKHFCGELAERLGEASLDLLGTGASLSEGSIGVIGGGAIERQLRRAIMVVIGGGTAEIQRNLIAIRGLDLPR